MIPVLLAASLLANAILVAWALTIDALNRRWQAETRRLTRKNARLHAHNREFLTTLVETQNRLAEKIELERFLAEAEHAPPWERAED